MNRLLATALVLGYGGHISPFAGLNMGTDDPWQWHPCHSPERMKELPPKQKRNDKCACGSGDKFKQCCQRKAG